MYTVDEIQDMIDDVRRNRETFMPFIDEINTRDRRAIMNVLCDGYYEAFDRYDSDVCEQFINAYEKCIDKKGWML